MVTRVLVVALCLGICHFIPVVPATAEELTFPKIDRQPAPAVWDREAWTSTPAYDPNSTDPWQMDFRYRDVSALDLSHSIEGLLYATFDDRTVWPASGRVPSDFDWQSIMELGKNPGLGVRSLHREGITGQGVRIAIIDQPLLVDHQEYADRLLMYEEIHIQRGVQAQMHGPAVASIAVGNTVGVAPEAELFYIAQWNFDWKKGERVPTLRYLAEGIHRIVDINEQLPLGGKIRAISISKGWTRNRLSDEEYRTITEAVQRARAAGMLVVCTSVELVHLGCDYAVLGRPPLADPDAFESYEPALFTAKRFWARYSLPGDDEFSVPIDSRTTASPTGVDEYVFYRRGGSSWAVPYIAGLYALAVQVDLGMTPECFWAFAVRTGRMSEVERNGKARLLGPIIDPVGLIRAIESGELPSRKPHDATRTIVPGVRIGPIALGMSKDEVLERLGEPALIYLGDERYSLDSLPGRYGMYFGPISVFIVDGAVERIDAHSSAYTFTNGLGVDDGADQVKEAFGDDFALRESEETVFLTYEGRGISFSVSKRGRTVGEINVFQAEHR